MQGVSAVMVRECVCVGVCVCLDSTSMRETRLLEQQPEMCRTFVKTSLLP